MNRIALFLVIMPLAASSAQRAPASERMRTDLALQLERPSLEDSLMNIQSSGQRAVALRRIGQTDDRATLLSVMRVTRMVPNSTDKFRVLESLAPRYLASGDATLIAAFFRTARTIPSSEELRDILIDVVPFAAKSGDLANAIIEVARLVPSSPDRSEVLAALVTSGAVTRSDVRENFGDALLEIPGERDRQSVLRATARSLRE